MNISNQCAKGKAEKWARYKYHLSTPLGADGTRLTGCQTHIALSRNIAGEGMVLLENDGTLPLKDGTTVALFGVGSLEYLPGGGGSGQIYPAYVKNLYEGFLEKAPRIRIFEPLSQFYYDYAAPLAAGQERISLLDAPKILPEPELPESLILEAAKHADVAIISIHRSSGEAWDRSGEKGDFYLTDAEQKFVTAVTTAFSQSVAVLNVGGPVDVSWIRENPKLGGALLAWQAGMEGGSAIADILCGDINPSGKLTDTFAKDLTDYPFADTFHESRAYVEYAEDIYVGYRYFETIPGAKEKVVYPFGYGLSYTSFSLSKPVASITEETVKISLQVTNTGNFPGKEVTQVYFSAPQGKLGKSKLTLAGFQKTKRLALGDSEKISISFPVSSMASYDDLGKCQASSYVLEQGQYRFFAGNSCRALQECDAFFTVTEPFIVTKALTPQCAPHLLRKRLRSDGSLEDLPAFQTTGKTPTIPEVTTGQTLLEKPLPFSYVAEGKLSLDAFLAQMTEEELIQMVSGTPKQGLSNTAGMGNVPRLGIPAVMTADGPAGLRLSPQTGIATTAFPCATLLACTWDLTLAQEMGRAGALECKENGLAIWLTPALNIHRNPLCGRNFEYFSEDPLISGKFAAAQVLGIQSTHTAACPKHFAANNKETNRLYCDSRVSERALREIYLKGFEICVKEAKPFMVMTSYNLINGQRSCESDDLIGGILREEWGFSGMVTTDWFVPCNQVNCVKAGNDIRMPRGDPEKLLQALQEGNLQRNQLEACVKRILQMLLKLD